MFAYTIVIASAPSVGPAIRKTTAAFKLPTYFCSGLINESWEDRRCSTHTSEIVDAIREMEDNLMDEKTTADTFDSQHNTLHLAQYLLNSVDVLDALEVFTYTCSDSLQRKIIGSMVTLFQDLEAIRDSKFSLLDEDFSSLDTRLSQEFSALRIPEDWTVLGTQGSGTFTATSAINGMLLQTGV